MPKKIRKSLNILLLQFKEIHGITYDYSKVNYLGSFHKVEIICRNHGSFFQRPTDHLSGSGCSKCKGCNKISQDEFIQKSKEVHRDRYILDNAIYINNKTKVRIICKNHGEFSISPSDFWNGVGCRHCGFDQSKSVKISKGIINDPATLDKFILYKRKVRSISEKNFREFYHIINPNNIVRSYYWHLDHKFSIYEGFHNNIAPEIIGHWTNLTMLERRPNQQKGIKSSVTLSGLLTTL